MIYLFAFFCFFMQASVKNRLIDIFSVNGHHAQEEWYQASDNQLTRALSDIGVEIFKSIYEKRQFNDEVDKFGFINKISKMSAELEMKYQTPNCWNETAKNPLNPNDQQKIIKIRQFLHFFSEQSNLVAGKLGLYNYKIFHSCYIKYALKISLHNPYNNDLHKEYSHCIDQLFWIETLSDETMNYYKFDYSKILPGPQYPFERLAEHLDVHHEKLNSCVVKNFCLKPHAKDPVFEKIQHSIDQLISSITQIQKYIRRSNEIEKYVANHSCRILQAYIKIFNVSSLRRERIFKVDLCTVRTPELPKDAWLNIFSFSVESIKDLLLVSRQFESLVINIINGVKESIDKNCFTNPFIQKIQEIDASVAFDSRSYKYPAPWRNKARKEYFFYLTEIPLNDKNREKIKAIRYFIAAIKNDGQYSDEIAHKLHLKNYGFFYDQYFSYALKILAPYSSLVTPQYCEQYLKCLDHNFYIEIRKNFADDDLPNYYDNDLEFDLQDALSTYYINLNNVVRPREPYGNGETVRIKIANFLLYVQSTARVSNSIISYCDNPTYLKKKIVLEEHSEQTLIKTQSFIRSYNEQCKLLELKKRDKAAIKLQSFVRSSLAKQVLAGLHNNKVIMHDEVVQKPLSTIIIQSHLKRLLAQNQLETLFKSLQVQKIQSHIRASNAKQTLDGLRDEKLQENVRKNLEAFSKNRSFRIKCFALMSLATLTAACLFYFCFLQKRFFSIS